LFMAGNSAAFGNAVHAAGASHLLFDTVLMRQAALDGEPLGTTGIVIADTATAEVRDSSLMTWEPMMSVLRLEGTAHARIDQTLIANFAGGASFQPTGITTEAGACNASAGSLSNTVLALFPVQTSATAFSGTDPAEPDADSGLIDACSGSHLLPGARDLYGRTRPVVAVDGQPATPMDIGAIERLGDRIFRSQFE